MLERGRMVDVGAIQSVVLPNHLTPATRRQLAIVLLAEPFGVLTLL